MQPSSLTWKDSTVLCKLPITIGTVRSAGARSSWCGTDRVGFSTSLERGMSPADLSYYQNVVFPLNRCFSAPLYENHRFSPYPIQEEDPLEPPERECFISITFPLLSNPIIPTISSSPAELRGSDGKLSKPGSSEQGFVRLHRDPATSVQQRPVFRGMRRFPHLLRNCETEKALFD